MEFIKILLVLTLIFLAAVFFLAITGSEMPMDPRDKEEDDRGQIEYLRQYRERKEEKENKRRARKLRKKLRRKQIRERFHGGKGNHNKE